MSTYHDLHITTPDIPRTRISDLSFGYEILCSRAGGWQLWDMRLGYRNAVLVAGEYAEVPLRLDVAGHVIVDSMINLEEQG